MYFESAAYLLLGYVVVRLRTDVLNVGAELGGQIWGPKASTDIAAPTTPAYLGLYVCMNCI